MCGKLFSPKAPALPPPIIPEPKRQETPTFGAGNKNLNSDKARRAKTKGSSGFKIDLQSADTKSGLAIGNQ